MPNDILIGQVEDMREQYNGRLRAANGLLASLKGTNGALTKATRLLREYPDSAPSIEGATLTMSREAFGSSHLKDEAIDPLLPELRRQSKALTSVVAALRDTASSLRGEIVDVVKLGPALTVVRAASASDPDLVPLVPPLAHELQQGADALGNTFGAALRHVLSAQGIEVGGRLPHFEIGRFDVEANFSTRSASMSYGKEMVVKRLSLAVDAVVKAYERLSKTVTGRNENPERWVEQFRMAWTLAGRKRGVGERANIVDCYYELVLLRQNRSFRIEPTKGGFADYSRAQFAYDFHQFSGARHPFEGEYIVAHSAAKVEAEKADKSLWIVDGHGPHDGRYIADITYAKV